VKVGAFASFVVTFPRRRTISYIETIPSGCSSLSIQEREQERETRCDGAPANVVPHLTAAGFEDVEIAPAGLLTFVFGRRRYGGH